MEIEDNSEDPIDDFDDNNNENNVYRKYNIRDEMI